MPNVESIAPQFFVEDLRRSVEWYVRVLGFAVAFQSEDYAGVRLGPASIVLLQVGPAATGHYEGACHLRIGSGIDDYIAQIEATGQALTATLKDRLGYGMREATVRDPDDNVIYIGQEM